MRSLICSKPFFTRNQINSLKIQQKVKFEETFNKSKRSSNNDIVIELYALLDDYLNSVFKICSAENDSRRELWGNNAIDEYTLTFKKNINSEIGTSVYIESQTFIEIVTKIKQNVMELFEELCADDKELLIVQYFKVSYF